MGGGAPLAFLNKKTWHPGRMQNLEEVWKREQAAAAEQRKLEELRKQYEDERKDSELTQIAEEAGYKRDARLDWMYAGSLAAKHAADTAAAGQPPPQQQEEAPLSKAPAPDEHLSRAERAVQLPSFLTTDTPASQNEAWARLNNDPLLAIKKQEQDALKRVRQNPIKMQQILKEVEKVRKDKKEKKSKKEKRDRKEKKHHAHSSSSSDSRDKHPAAPPAGGLKRGRPRSESPVQHRSRLATAAAAARDSGPADWVNNSRQPDRYADREYRPAAAAVDRQRDNRGQYVQPGHQQQEQWQRHQQQARDSSRQHAAKRYRSRSRSRSRSRDHGHDRPAYRQQQQQALARDHDRHANHQGSEHGHANGVDKHGAAAPGRDYPMDGDVSRDRHGSDRSQHRPAAGSRDHDHDNRSDRRHDHSSRHQTSDHDRHDHADDARHKISSSNKDGRYGLELTGGRYSSRGVDVQQMAAAAEARAAATRQRLAEADAAQAEAAAAAAAAGKVRQRQEYRTGKLSAEQKAARLAEMMGNAQQHEQQRRERLEQARAAEDSERGVTGLLAKAAAAQAEDAFKSAAAAEVFGSLTAGGMSLDARISSRRHYQER